MSNNNNQYIRLYNFKLFNFNIKLINCIGLFEQNYCSLRERQNYYIYFSNRHSVV